MQVERRSYEVSIIEKTYPVKGDCNVSERVAEVFAVVQASLLDAAVDAGKLRAAEIYDEMLRLREPDEDNRFYSVTVSLRDY